MTPIEKSNLKVLQKIKTPMTVDPHFPFNIQSQWLPAPGSASLQEFFRIVLNEEAGVYPPSVEALNKLIEENSVVQYLVDNACQENENIKVSHAAAGTDVLIPRIKDKETILKAFTAILKWAPHFINDDLVGLPFSAFVVGIDPTLSGSELFRLPLFNNKMSAILQQWNKFLGTEASNVGFRVEGKQWLSTTAKKQYDFPIWKKDSETLPYWNSWNSFFTRQFLDRDISRPIADPESNATINCPNDGSLFRWRRNILKKDVFWFKDMEYSLADILSSPIPEQQAVIDKYDLVDMFTNGYIFQTYLNPYNFHRWWVPVNAKVLFDPLVVPGCFFNKLILPDFGGATTASLPYLAQVNARGIIVFETEDFGRVCCIPLGMSEVSTIEFDPAMVNGATVSKGQEMGKFNYGGSSFAIIFERLPGKDIIFVNAEGVYYQQDPPQASSSSGSGGETTYIGSQIGVWVDVS